MIHYNVHTPTSGTISVGGIDFFQSYHSIVGVSYRKGTFRTDKKYSPTTSKQLTTGFGGSKTIPHEEFEQHVKQALKEALFAVIVDGRRNLTHHERVFLTMLEKVAV